MEITLRKFVNFFENLNRAEYNLKYSKVITTAFFTLVLNISNNFQANSQVIEPIVQDSTLQTNTVISQQDSITTSIDSVLTNYAALDTLGLDSLQIDSLAIDSIAADSLSQQPVGDIKTTVHYKASDSITLNMVSQDVKLFGNAKIDYKPITVSAASITVNWEKNEMRAEGRVDSLGSRTGVPVFTNGGETYETEDIAYNFKTEKAAITGLVTQQGDGYIHADQVFRNAKGEFYNKTTLYTTCNLAHPHFSIKARKVKVIPGKEMISGPFNMIINDVPTPAGFPFGIFPDMQSRTSGIIFPDFGEETLRGFYLRNGGYYFAISDYVNLELTGDIYTKGGWGFKAASQYKKRYGFDGRLLFNYTKRKSEDPNTLEFQEANDFRFSWSHSPQTKGTGRFSANVNIASSTYNQNNIINDQDDQIRTTLSSNVSYSKSFKGTPITMSLAGRFNQNLKTKKADILLPDFALNVQNLYPFKSKTGASNKWYNKLTIRYAMNATNKLTNTVFINDTDSTLEINAETLPLMIKNGSNGFQHTIPLSTTIPVFKHFTLNPSLGYKELWYFKKLNYEYDAEQGGIVTDTIPGFSAVRTYNAAVSLNTRVYGTLFFKRKYGVQAIRHQMTPSLSFNYVPDFSDPKFDYYKTVQSDSLGNTRTISRYAGFVYGSPGRGESGSISLSVTNNLEMKTLSRKDTTGKAKKVVLLRNFGFSTAYNVVADSFNLSQIQIRATTTLFQNQNLGKSAKMNPLNVNFSGTIDPYTYLLDSLTIDSRGGEKVYQRRIDKFAWQSGQGLGNFSRLTVALSTGFSAQRRSGSNSTSAGRNTNSQRFDNEGDVLANTDREAAEYSEFLSNPDYYVDFNIPWSLRFSYNVNFSQVGFAKGKVTQSLRFNGDLSLTEKWKVTFNSGYDFEQNKFTETRLNIVRDLHCWDMTLSWVPYGRFQSYNFTIKAKSSLLQDLKLSKKRNATDSFTF